MKKIKLEVKGMHCKSCSMLIKDALEETNGIKNAEVSNEKGIAIIDFDETKVNEKEIKKIIKKEGYKVK